jgi:hypothetical protein
MLLSPKNDNPDCQTKKLLTFNTNTISMRLPKLTALFLGLSMIALTSCKSTSEVEQDNIYVGTITMSGAQETPAVTTAASGTIDANYNRLTKTLSYKVSWSGLSGNVTNMHIHGTGEVGVMAGVIQTFSGWPAAPAGTYSSSILIDGTKFTEADLLAKRYYINIHTALNPAGEIRGQLNLNKK